MHTKKVMLAVFLFNVIAILFISEYAFAKMPAPKLYPKYPDILTWTWHHKDPYRWNLYSIMRNGTLCVIPSDYWAYGNSRQFSPDGGSTPMFIVGIDQNGNEITGRSNVVIPDDAPIPGAKPIKTKKHFNYDYGACGK